MKVQKSFEFLAIFMVLIGASSANFDAEVTEIKKNLPSFKKTLSEIKTTLANLRSNKEKMEKLKLSLAATYNRNIEAVKSTTAIKVKGLQEIFIEKVAERETAIDEVARNHAAALYKTRFSSLENSITKFVATYDKTYGRFTTSLNKSIDSLRNYFIPEAQTNKAKVETPVNKLLAVDIGGTLEQKLQRMEAAKEKFYIVNKQIQLNQFHEEEKQRSDGNSGIKQIRSRKVGGKNYYSNTHSGGSFASIHNHANNIRTVGMGEFTGVLNGIEFRTRHNDYRLNKPASTSTYKATEHVTFPDVPPEVTNKPTVQEQVIEMQKWFKAFKDQDYSVRDYRKYFKPILVYLEGAWTIGKQDGSIDEPFDSDRHHIDATSWLDLQEKIQYTSYTGTKSALENLSHLPTKIVGFKNKRPILAQWNYRIICHELKFKDGGTLPLDALKLDLDLASLMGRGISKEKYKNSRAAKFNIEGSTVDQRDTNAPLRYSMLDSFMEQIPGFNNYNYEMNLTEINNPRNYLYSSHPSKSGELLNAANYHRTYQTKNTDGSYKTHQRGFSDRLYIAHNTQKRIAGFSYNFTNANGDQIVRDTRLSYAEPIEIVYLTPLQRWNPHNIPFETAPTKVTIDGSIAKPFINASPRNYYITPASFYTLAKAGDTDPADTVPQSARHVSLNNITYPVRASGIHIFLPEIQGVGVLRTRFPIMPIHGEGGAAWKRLNALEDIMQVQSPKSQQRILVTGLSQGGSTTQHSHIIDITKEEYEDVMFRRKTLEIETSTANAHSHVIKVARKWFKTAYVIVITLCDGKVNDAQGLACFDKHVATVE